MLRCNMNLARQSSHASPIQTPSVLVLPQSPIVAADLIGLI
jgi:hypothetical protein